MLNDMPQNSYQSLETVNGGWEDDDPNAWICGQQEIIVIRSGIRCNQWLMLLTQP
jgi:hypothetical protein